MTFRKIPLTFLILTMGVACAYAKKQPKYEQARQLTADQAQAWLKALNDVRLALGIRLDVSEDFEDQWGRLTPEDPQWTAFEVYAWLGAVQESLVQALTP